MNVSKPAVRIRTAHRSLRPTVIATATAHAKLFIELILNDQWRSLKQLKTEAAYATVGKLIAQYQRNARIDLQLFETTSA